MEVYGLSLTEDMEKTRFNELLEFVDAEKKDRIGRFLRYEDAQRALLADLLIRNVLCRKLKVPNSCINFDKNEYGKPFLKNYTGVHFNISHSYAWVVCAVSDEPVGIDIEKIKPMDLDIAKRFFSKDEYESLVSKNDYEQLQGFFEFWSLKESYIKAWGKGLSVPLDSFTIRIDLQDIKVLTDNEYNNCFFRQYDIDKDYKMAVCSEKKDFPDSVVIKTIEEIYDFFINSNQSANNSV